MQGDSRWCRHCGRQVFAIHQKLETGVLTLHSVLVVLTCGLWLPIWLWVCVRQVYRCRDCGQRV